VHRRFSLVLLALTDVGLLPITKLPADLGDGMITTMGRARTHQATPDLFSTDMVRDASPPPTKQVPASETASDSASQRHILPKDLPNAVKHLTDRELDLLISASVEEAKRRGRLPPSVRANTPDEPKRSSSRDKRQAELATVSLTRGQVNAVRAAFQAGITPSRIARQFGISQSDVRKVLASDAGVHAAR
jgi:predicted DNA binding protein